MKPTVSRHPLHRPLSLLLTCAMLLTLLLPAASAAEGQASLSLDHTTLSLAESQEYFRATLTMDVPDTSSGWTQADWDSWAGGLEWYLTRDAADSPQDPDLYPNVYTGDALKNWMSWGTINGNGADGSPYFTLEPPTVTVADGRPPSPWTSPTGYSLKMRPRATPCSPSAAAPSATPATCGAALSATTTCRCGRARTPWPPPSWR